MTKTDNGQAKSDIQEMVDFYGKTYSEVYLIHCLACKRVIGVECTAPQPSDPLVTDRGRALHLYQNLCLSVRQRIDKTPHGEFMYGYECACGNKTTLSAIEKGNVPETTVKVNKLSGAIVDRSEPLPAQSPFEMARTQQAVDAQIASSDYKPDYELSGNKERFETFMIERVK